jgi:hypothetical protein
MAATVKDQAQPDARHEDRVDPAAGPSPATGAAPGSGNLEEVQRRVEQLQERLTDLERRGENAPAAVYSDPDHAPTGVNLQEILPRIKDLAQCVGGMKELARLVTTLAESKE